MFFIALLFVCRFPWRHHRQSSLCPGIRRGLRRWSGWRACRRVDSPAQDPEFLCSRLSKKREMIRKVSLLFSSWACWQYDLIYVSEILEIWETFFHNYRKIVTLYSVLIEWSHTPFFWVCIFSENFDVGSSEVRSGFSQGNRGHR